MKKTAKSVQPAAAPVSGQPVTAASPSTKAADKAKPAKQPQPVAAPPSGQPARTLFGKPVGPAPILTVTLKKQPKNGELQGQAEIIVATLAAKGKKLTVPELIKALEGKIVTRNVKGLADVWAMNRKRLVEEGYVTVA